ncbi:MAG TPA: HD domain-containing phosphohydrolase [Tepidisphaeraceae bacterium]|nr:HD domain-containing phosphohydrolase [Tepidisphaeraceae bacterium]
MPSERTADMGDPSMQIKLSEVIGALSYALDITEGQPQGHAARSCMLGMRIAREMRLPVGLSSALFYGLLLKDLGCSSNASKMCYLFGSDDRAAKRDVKTVDWARVSRSIGYIARHVSPQGSILRKAGKFVRVAMGGIKEAKELIALRCERGATIARQLQLPDDTAAAIRALDEHWDGNGHPDGLEGEEIPPLARILGLAQTAEVFIRLHGLDAAMDMARQRSETWFDPELVKIFLSLKTDSQFWEDFQQGNPRERVIAYEPEDQLLGADESSLDRIAYSFAQVIDAKSPWTFAHSEGVARISTGIADVLGFDRAKRRYIRRAALLHDIGKLGISNLILDKPGKLTSEEFTEMRKHTRYTYELLTHVTGFRQLADLAASHHERLDGKGYHRGLTADQLSTPARILAVADMYEALSAKRPYRQDLTSEEVMTILTKNVGPGICPDVFSALMTWLAESDYQPFKLAA